MLLCFLFVSHFLTPNVPIQNALLNPITYLFILWHVFNLGHSVSTTKSFHLSLLEVSGAWFNICGGGRAADDAQPRDI